MFKYGPYGDCPTVKFYVLTESGKLYLVSALTYTDGGSYTVQSEFVGSTRLNLSGVSVYKNNKTASMDFDRELAQLILTASDGKEAKLYAIDVNTRLVAELGAFPGAAGMSTLYTYDRADTLTVRLRTGDQDLYVGDRLQASATVLPEQYEDKVVWSSSAPEVLSVDENGLMTALSTGTAVVTATSVATDENGQTASASCTITVLPLKQVDLHVKAQVSNADGSQWVSIDTADLNVTKLADARTQLEGGGVHGGVIYGTEKPLDEKIPFIKADPSDSYRETLSSNTVPSNYAVLDAVTVPGRTDVLHDKKGNEYVCDIFGYPMFLYEEGIIGYLQDFDSAEMSNWGLMGVSFHKALCAMAYAGSVPMETDKYGMVDNQVLYVLACDGTLFQFDHYCYSMTVGVSQAVTALTPHALGNVGRAFPNKEDVTMTYVHDEVNGGLLIGYGSGEQVELYYIDLTDGQMQCRKVGNLPAYTDIASIYTEYDLNLEPSQAIRKGTDTESSSLLPMSYTDGQEYVLEELPDGAANSVGPQAASPASVIANEDGTLTVTVTARNADGEDVTVHSANLNVSYNAEALKLTDVQMSEAFHAEKTEEGSVTLAFADLTSFSDQSRISPFARPAMEWAVAAGLVQGMKNGTIAPRDTLNRVQLAALLTRLDQDILK